MRVPPGTPGARICVECKHPFKAAHIATKTCSHKCGYDLRRKQMQEEMTRGALGANGAHNPDRSGSNPTPATTFPGARASFDIALPDPPVGVKERKLYRDGATLASLPPEIVRVAEFNYPDGELGCRGYRADGSFTHLANVPGRGWTVPDDGPVTFNLVEREPGAGPSHEHGAASALANAFGMTAVLDPIVNAGKGVELPASLIEPKGGYAVPAPVRPVKHPTGWEPHVETRGDVATGVTAPMTEANADEEAIIRSFKFDPAEWMIRGDINCRRWQAIVPVRGEDGKVTHHEERWLYYYKVSLVRRTSKLAVDFESVAEEIRTYVPPEREPAPEGSVAFVVCIADLQCGKLDGDGSQGVVKRFLDGIESVAQRALDLREIGVPIGPLYVFGLGDLIEQCGQNYYAMGLYSADLNMRDQCKVVFRLILKALKSWAPLFEKVVVAAIPGNHGEASRADGKATTDFGDNWDVALFEYVESALAENPAAFGHVSFVLPKSELTLTLDVCGTVVGLAHGHQFGKGAGVTEKVTKWWSAQAHGTQPVGSAQILLTGHFHHLVVNASGSKTHIQAPSLEGGSDWWRHLTGQVSAKGLLTLVVGSSVGPPITPDLRAGWDHMAVL